MRTSFRTSGSTELIKIKNLNSAAKKASTAVLARSNVDQLAFIAPSDV